MIEPPTPGFTGVVWEARPTDQLARDLTGGPGSVPLVEAAAAWTGLAASFGAAVGEYDRIIAGIRGHWQSETSDDVVERLSAMRTWLTDIAAAAARNAEHTAFHAASFEVARLAMPHIAEIAALHEALRTLQAVGTSLGGPLVGGIAEVDADNDVAKTTAARVMRTYESATEPLAAPWQHSTPPVLASPAAFAAEQTAVAPDSNPLRGPSPISSPPMVVPSVVPRVLAGARVRAVAPVRTAPELVVATQAPTASVSGGGGQLLPPAALAGAAAAGEDEHTPSAGAAELDAGAALELDAGITAVPAVLGGPQPTASATGIPAE